MSNEPARDSRLAALRARAETGRLQVEERYGETWLFGIALDVYRSDQAIAGGELAGALAYRLFLWFLPFMLVMVAGFGVYSDATAESPEAVADRFGLASLIAESVAEAAQSNARWYALVIGVPILLYLTRKLLRTVVAVHRLAWGLELRRGHTTVSNVLLLLGALVAFLAVGALVSGAAHWNVWSWIVVAPLTILVRGAIWLFVSERLPRADCPWQWLLPGAAVVGVGLLGVNAFSLIAISEIAASRQDTYGALGVAAAVLFSLWLTSRVVILSAVVNFVLWERHGPTGSLPRPPGRS